MPRIVRCGLIQASNVKSPDQASLAEIRDAMIEKHLGLIGHTETGDGQLHGTIRAVTGLDPVNVFTQITATLCAEQGHGK